MTNTVLTDSQIKRLADATEAYISSQGDDINDYFGFDLDFLDWEDFADYECGIVTIYDGEDEMIITTTPELMTDANANLNEIKDFGIPDFKQFEFDGQTFLISDAIFRG